MQSDQKGKGVRARKRSVLLDYRGVTVQTAYGPAHAHLEVVLNVEVRVDPKGHDEPSGDQSGRDNLQRIVRELAERVSCFYEFSNPAQAAPAAQAELVFSLEET